MRRKLPTGFRLLLLFAGLQAFAADPIRQVEPRTQPMGSDLDQIQADLSRKYESVLHEIKTERKNANPPEDERQAQLQEALDHSSPDLSPSQSRSMPDSDLNDPRPSYELDGSNVPKELDFSSSSNSKTKSESAPAAKSH